MLQTKRKKQLMSLCLTAIFTALTTVVTMFIQIPNPATGGYVNIGDCVILIAGTLLGPLPGLFVGGVGSAIADLATGYAHWAFPTFVIKGLEGFLCGLTTYFIFRHTQKRSVKLAFTALTSILCATIMMVGYIIANLAMGGTGKAIASIIPNTIQAGISVAIDLVVVTALIKTPFFDGIFQDAFMVNKKVEVSETDEEDFVIDNNNVILVTDKNATDCNINLQENANDISSQTNVNVDSTMLENTQK